PLRYEIDSGRGGGVGVQEKMLRSWSGGKDSCMTLYELEKTGGYQIASLLTTVTDEYDRISMHGVRRTLLERQAESLGLPLYKIYIQTKCAKREYESIMDDTIERI